MASPSYPDEPPAYSSSLDDKKPTTLQEKFAQARSNDSTAQQQQARIQSSLDKHIKWCLEYQASKGIAASSIIVVPSDVVELQVEPVNQGVPLEHCKDLIKSPAVEHGHKGMPLTTGRSLTLGQIRDHACVVRLQDTEDTSSLWTDPTMMAELQMAIRELLGLSRKPEAPKAKPGKERTTKPWWKRLIAVTSDHTTSQEPELQTVRVKCEEVSMRTKGHLDLYEVRNGFAVVIEVTLAV